MTGPPRPASLPPTHDDVVPRRFLRAALVWGVVAAALWAWSAILLWLPVLQERFRIGERETAAVLLSWLTERLPGIAFGRARPLAEQLFLLGVVGNAIFAAMTVATTRAQGRPWATPNLARWHVVLWQAAMLVMLATPPARQWPVDVALIGLWPMSAIGLLATTASRRNRALSPEIWCFVAAAVALPGIALVRLADPGGIGSHVVAAWFDFNLLAFAVAVPTIGLAYHLLPNVTGGTVRSRRAAAFHVWATIALCPLAGTQVLQHEPVPAFVPAMGVAAIWVLAVVQLVGLWNLAGCLRHRGSRLIASPALLALTTAVALVAFWLVEAAVLGLVGVGSVARFTSWATGNTELVLLGVGGLVTVAVAGHLGERLWHGHRPMPTRAAFWLAIAGLLLIALPGRFGGLSQGLMWQLFTPTGQLRFANFTETTHAVVPQYVLQSLGGGALLASLALLGFSLRRRRREGEATEPVVEPPATPIPIEPGRYAGVGTMPDLARRIDAAWRLVWADYLALRPRGLAAVAIGVVLVGGLLTLASASASKPTGVTSQLTPLEEVGRGIYVTEGCRQCHSQLVRPILAEVKRYGDPTTAGEVAAGGPLISGDRRVGPDLARLGRTRSAYWLWLHFERPQQVVPGSLMPGYPHLIEAEIELPPEAIAQAREIAGRIREQGGPVNVDRRGVVALIAYLQALGEEAR